MAFRKYLFPLFDILVCLLPMFRIVFPLHQILHSWSVVVYCGSVQNHWFLPIPLLLLIDLPWYGTDNFNGLALLLSLALTSIAISCLISFSCLLKNAICFLYSLHLSYWVLLLLVQHAIDFLPWFFLYDLVSFPCSCLNFLKTV